MGVFFKRFQELLLLVAVLLLVAGCSDPEVRYQESLEEVRSLIGAGDYENALTVLNSLSESYPERTEILVLIGDAHEGSGSPFFAGLFYERAAEANPDFGDRYYAAARLFAEEGERLKALSAVNNYLELFPDDADAWRFSADLLARENRIQSALSAHLRAESLDGPARNPAFAAEMGRLYLQAGNTAQAGVYFRTAAEESPPDRLPALLGQLEIAYRGEDFETAEALLETLDVEFPGAVDSSDLAAARNQIKMWRVTQDTIAEELARLEAEEARRKAEAEAAAAAEAAEAAAEAETAEVIVLEENGSTPDSAGKLTGPPVEMEPPPPPPPPPPTPGELAEAARDAGDWNEAVRLYWRAVGSDGEDAGLWAGLSEAALAAGEPDTAEMAILEALRREPNELRYTLTYLHVIQQTRSRARFLEELERTYEEVPNSPDVVLLVARAYAQPGGNPTNAAFFYRKFLEMSPNHPEVVAARRELNALP